MAFNIKIRTADKLFSQYIRERDKWTCQRCGKVHEKNSRNFGVSHYWGRKRESTRFEPDNCVSLCNIPCHQSWGHGDEKDAYREYMIRRLGQARFDSLMIQANTYKKRDDKMAIIYIKLLMESLKGDV